MADALAVLGSKISDYASPDRQLMVLLLRCTSFICSFMCTWDCFCLGRIFCLVWPYRLPFPWALAWRLHQGPWGSSLSYTTRAQRWHTISSGLDGVLRCFTKDESLEATREVHKGSCGQHQGGINHSCELAITDFPFDRVKFGQLCRTCQLHTPFEGPTSKATTLCCCVWDFALNII